MGGCGKVGGVKVVKFVDEVKVEVECLLGFIFVIY